jgi:hypothetical protein
MNERGKKSDLNDFLFILCSVVVCDKRTTCQACTESPMCRWCGSENECVHQADGRDCSDRCAVQMMVVCCVAAAAAAAAVVVVVVWLNWSVLCRMLVHRVRPKPAKFVWLASRVRQSFALFQMF